MYTHSFSEKEIFVVDIFAVQQGNYFSHRNDRIIDNFFLERRVGNNFFLFTTLKRASYKGLMRQKSSWNQSNTIVNHLQKNRLFISNLRSGFFKCGTGQPKQCLFSYRQFFLYAKESQCQSIRFQKGMNLEIPTLNKEIRRCFVFLSKYTSYRI